MSTYSFYVLPPEAFTVSDGSDLPIRDAFTAQDGSAWKDAQGSFTYSRDALMQVNVHDADDQNQTLNDYSNGEKTQTLIDAVGPFPAGTPIENEFEISLKLKNGVDDKEYRLVALSSDGKIVGYTFDGEWPPTGTRLEPIWKGTEDSDNNTLEKCGMQAPCFTRGTLIATPKGHVAIETLAEGDLVMTRDRGAQPIRWIGSAELDAQALHANPKMQPIRIRAGALGQGLPTQDLLVSPQHRVLLRSRIAAKMFGADEVLVAAKQLLQIDGIDIADDVAEAEYFHFLFDRHEVVNSNGAATESLFTGPEALKAVDRQARQEIFSLFPQLRSADFVATPARPIPAGRRSRKLAVRHAQRPGALVS